MAANGYFSGFWASKTIGIKRMLGLVQVTGFHSAGGGSLVTRLLAEVGVFWTTYFILLLAVPMMLLVLRHGSARPRMLALVYCAAALTMAYAVFLGTLEEQELYLLVLPSLLIIPVAAAELSLRWRSSRAAPRRHPGRAPAAVMVTALALTLGLNVFTIVQWLRQPDYAFVHLYEYVTAHVPRGTVIAALETDDLTPSLQGPYQVPICETPAALSAAHAQYLVVLWGEITTGTSDITVAQVHQLIGPAQPVFSQLGRTNGPVVLYKLPPSAGPVRSRDSRVPLPSPVTH